MSDNKARHLFVVLSVPACRKAKKGDHCHHLSPSLLPSFALSLRSGGLQNSMDPAARDMINQSIGQPFFFFVSAAEEKSCGFFRSHLLIIFLLLHYFFASRGARLVS